MGRWTKQSKIHEKLIKLVGVTNTLKILSEFGGKTIWVPSAESFLKSRRDLRIYEEFKSGKYNMKELADRWQISYITIQRVIYKLRDLENDE